MAPFTHRPNLNVLLVLAWLICPSMPVWGENVAPGVHWGAIDFPDRDPTLMMGFTVNRFTEFDANGERFNAVTETAGYNFATITWTDRLRAFPRWAGNLTLGVGPTGETPSENLQSAIHHATGQGQVPAGQVREGGDGMVGGSLMRWTELFSSRDTGFGGLGVTGGSLYQAVYGRIGVRHLSLGELAAWLFPHSDLEVLNGMSKIIRFSAMGRYSRLYEGAAYSNNVLADESYLGQFSVSLGDHEAVAGTGPRWELEFSYTYDSGLFAAPDGSRITRRFVSAALRSPYGTIESWNDGVGYTDSGPTGGFSVMLNVLTLYSVLFR